MSVLSDNPSLDLSIYDGIPQHPAKSAPGKQTPSPGLYGTLLASVIYPPPHTQQQQKNSKWKSHIISWFQRLWIREEINRNSMVKTGK